MSNNITVQVKTCRQRCHELENYVAMKRIKFGPEMGYKKCTVCECHFFKVDKVYCECCGFRLRSTVRRRKVVTKEKAKEFLISIS
jgi:ribosomal protein L37E